MQLPNGTEFSHFRIIRKIGAGGRGVVYLAEDLSLQRQVALKFLDPSAAQSPTDKAQLLSEARAAASHQHPARVTVYEVGEYRDLPYLVMEYVAGTTVDHLVSAGQVEPTRVVEIVIQVCEGLESAHGCGIIHGDIKPSNLIIDGQGRVRLLDFGVARLLNQPRTSEDGSVSGTLRYMAPEVVLGSAHDKRSDLYSVGVLLYHLLSCQLPFSGPYEAAVAYMIVNEPAPSLSSLVPGLSPDLVSVVRRLMEKDPADRFQNAGELIHALRNVDKLDTAPVLHPPVHSATPWRRVITIAGLVVTLGSFTWFLVGRGAHSDDQRVTLAVLPFDNLGAAGDDYFADGVTDEVTHQLARIAPLGVISRNSAVLYKDSDKKLPQIAAELGANYLVTGTIHWERATTGHVRINMSLVRSTDDSYVWTESFDGELDGIFELQTDIASRIASALDLTRQSKVLESRSRPTFSLAAYDFYLRGNEYFNKTWEQPDLAIAGSLYGQAIALDSTFAAAYAMASRVDASLHWERYDVSPARCQAAFTEARRALELDPEIDVGYLALGYCYYHCQRNYDSALAEYQKGLSLHPNQSDLHNGVAAVLRRQGKIQEALDGFMEALRLDPRSHLKAFEVGLTLGMQRRFDEAQPYLERATLLAPDYALAQVVRAWLPVLGHGDTLQSRNIVAKAAQSTDLTTSPYYWWLLRILEPNASGHHASLSKGSDYMSYYLYRARMARVAGHDSEVSLYSDSARANLVPRLALQPDNAYLISSLAVALAGLGRADSAVALANSALTLFPSSSEPFEEPFLALNLAEILTVFHQPEQAIDLLEVLLSRPGFACVPYLRLDPLWDPLREEPRFKALLTKNQPAS